MAEDRRRARARGTDWSGLSAPQPGSYFIVGRIEYLLEVHRSTYLPQVSIFSCAVRSAESETFSTDA